MRIFLDTNVLVSAFATRGICADLFRHILSEHDLVLGEVVLTELRRVLRDRFRLPKARVQEIDDFLRNYEVVPIPEDLPPIKIRDPDDVPVLASAIAAHADVIITGDDDLLDLKHKSPVRIQSPRDFWNEMAKRIS